MSRIKQARRRLGLTQVELASAAGVSPATVTEVELGKRQPQGRTMRKLATVLGVEVADLVEEEEETGPKVAARAHFPELPGLVTARKRRGISRNELAARSGLAPTYVAELEEGTREATPDILERLTGALNASPLELGAPAAQYAAFLEEAERDAERMQRELDELSPSEIRALAKRALLESRAARKIHDALEESPERQSTEGTEAG